MYSFGASSTEGFWPTSLILGKDGNFYGTTSHGGASGGGTVFRITLAGVETVLYAFGTSSTDGNNPNTLIQAADANLYGTTLQGGANISDGTVFKVTLAGAETITYSFGISNADGYYPVSVIQGSDGNFYGTAGGGSLGHGVVFKLSN